MVSEALGPLSPAARDLTSVEDTTRGVRSAHPPRVDGVCAADPIGCHASLLGDVMEVSKVHQLPGEDACLT